jgi:hypothetical protein
LLIQLANLPCLKPFFSPHPLSLVPFTLPDGSSLFVCGWALSRHWLTHFPAQARSCPVLFFAFV